MMWFPLRIAIALTGAVLSGCISLKTGDVYRPLHRDSAPDYAVVVPRLAESFPQTEPKEIKSSLKRLWFSRSHFGVFTGYQDWANYLSFEDIKSSIDTFPQNPFAWAQLGNYLALEKQPEAAVVAADHALSILAQARKSSSRAFGPDLDALQWTTQINRAIFLNLAGQFQEAQKELDSVELGSNGEPFVRLAVAWTRCIALIGDNKPDDALKLLELGFPDGLKVLPPTSLFKEYDYPQYFESNKRDAVFAFLKGEALLRGGFSSMAERMLRSSLKSDPELWIARLSLGTSLYGQGKLKEAGEVLESLVKMRPTKTLYSYELAVFNLANLQLETGKTDEAIGGYRAVIDSALRRDEVFERKIASTLPIEIRSATRKASDGRIVAEATNNLGVALLHSEDEDWEDAIELFSKAPASERGISLGNLAHAKWQAGEKEEAVTLYLEAVRSGREGEDVGQTLLEYGVGSGEPSLTYAALLTYLDNMGSKWPVPQNAELQNVRRAAILLLSPEQAKDIVNRVDQFTRR